jgi:hypothetical protein
LDPNRKARLNASEAEVKALTAEHKVRLAVIQEQLGAAEGERLPALERRAEVAEVELSGLQVALTSRTQRLSEIEADLRDTKRDQTSRTREAEELRQEVSILQAHILIQILQMLTDILLLSALWFQPPGVTPSWGV